MLFTKANAFLQFATGETFDIYEFNCRYSILTIANANEVPTAIVRLPVDASTVDGRISTANDILNRFEYYRFNLCAIFCQTTRTVFANPFNTSFVPGNQIHLLFLGFPVAASKVFVGQTPHVEIQLKHWLSFLELTSIFNSAVPSAVVGHFSLFHPNTFLLFGQLSDFGMNLKFLPLLLLQLMYEFVPQNKWDFWWYILLPLLDSIILASIIIGSHYRITRNDPLFLLLGRMARRALLSTNPLLSRIPASFYHIERNPFFLSYLRKIFSSKDSREIAKYYAYTFRKNIAEDIGNFLEVSKDPKQFSSFGKYSVLHLLLAILTHLHCALVPYPLAYGVVPFCLGLQAFWSDKDGPTILPGDILDGGIINRPSAETVPVRASIAVSDYTFHAGSQLEDGRGRNILLSGAYLSRRMMPGVFSVFPLPSFYRDLSNAGILLDPKTQYFLFEALNEMENEKGRIDQGIGREWANYSTIAANIAKFLINQYAQLQYVSNQIQNRALTVTVPFRGDIPPGATIRVRFAHPNDPGPRMLSEVQGTVKDVTYMGGQTYFNTTYTIIGWRTVPELNHPDFSIPYHPIYGVYWVGNYHLATINLP